MPPRIRKPSFFNRNQTDSLAPLRSCRCQNYSPARLFSSTPQYATRQRRDMWRWIQGPGAVFRDPLPGSTNYLNAYDASGNLIRAGNGSRLKEEGSEDIPSKLPGEDESEGEETKNIASGEPIPKEQADDLTPFPLNRNFRSQPVLSEELREEIWNRVILGNQSVKTVSAGLNVEMSRVGAVVRLKSVEKEWENQGKPLVNTYARAILSMLPSTPYSPNGKPTNHETINDLPVHRDTLPQIFYPVSESRHFTRADAGRVFNSSLLPADDRIPHPELISMAKDEIAGIVRSEREERLLRRNELELQKAEQRRQMQKEKEERGVTIVQPENGRWAFRFKEISVEEAGRNGRGRKGVGARYGFPHEDRKKGQIKIPRRVD